MDSDTARPLVVALLCVLAIALAAATLNTAVTTDGGGGGIGFGTGSSFGSEDAENSPSRNGTERGGLSTPFEFPCYPVLSSPAAIALILGLFFLAVGIGYRRLGALGAIAVVGPVGIPLLLLHALLTACEAPTFDGPSSALPNSSNSTLPGGGSLGSGDGATSMLTPSVALFVILGIALLGALVLLVKSSSGTELEPQSSDEAPDEEDIAAVGRAAGDAADRIESDASVENEVYRTWREMTTHLDVSDPKSSTPGEFAAAAMDAGIAREDVTELTNIFEEVRYGGEDATGERETRAVAALRRIERTYAEDDE
ncbi:protein of unknown function [Haladaptatus litoreus]|uniref:Protein-glutamine gamma-glutamyltransferase-like C-terminal domain-containing protein n=1 Tax=Haladaptatus litoreus TaxID=553468 RepID=A0A1N6WFQ1_9EURY|nr:DUF4129 domain-containing protein [Haladaptatus litoreus]SIQ88822.1 protein of unknown function [Haladaptatus litoreus]